MSERVFKCHPTMDQLILNWATYKFRGSVVAVAELPQDRDPGVENVFLKLLSKKKQAYDIDTIDRFIFIPFEKLHHAREFASYILSDVKDVLSVRLATAGEFLN